MGPLVLYSKLGSDIKYRPLDDHGCIQGVNLWKHSPTKRSTVTFLRIKMGIKRNNVGVSMAGAATTLCPLSAKLSDMFVNMVRFSGDLYREDMEQWLDEFTEDREKSGDPILLAISEYKGLFAVILVDEKNQIHINKHAIKALRNYWAWNYRRCVEKIIPDIAQILNDGNMYQTSTKVSAFRLI